MITADEVWNVMRDHGITGVMEWMHPNHSLMEEAHNKGQHKYIVRLGSQFFDIHHYDDSAIGGFAIYVVQCEPVPSYEFWHTREDGVNYSA